VTDDARELHDQFVELTRQAYEQVRQAHKQLDPECDGHATGAK